MHQNQPGSCLVLPVITTSSTRSGRLQDSHHLCGDRPCIALVDTGLTQFCRSEWATDMCLPLQTAVRNVLTANISIQSRNTATFSASLAGTQRGFLRGAGLPPGIDVLGCGGSAIWGAMVDVKRRLVHIAPLADSDGIQPSNQATLKRRQPTHSECPSPGLTSEGTDLCISLRQNNVHRTTRQSQGYRIDCA
jgi:hypothetical protein